ncbi:AraC family transcriptional regulator [Rhodococcus sp. DMF-1]|uniref:AraC family transcriptional regulator n=1 Tax=Rhodococcus TaxID=1827 RepID=UPI000B047A6B|nr:MULTISPECIES: AraC family transcriptional regulator [Rhodococcus]UIR37428.1 AraC family transcriptional regulator [Rhodococcus sp. DMF-1]
MGTVESSDTGIRQSATTAFRSDDIDASRTIGGGVFYPHEVRVLGSERTFEMQLRAVTCGPITLGMLDYSTEVEISTGELLDAYQINIPLRGELVTGSGDGRMVATPDVAAVYRCDRRTILRGWSSAHPAPVLAVKIDRRALEDQLSERIGRALTDPIAFGVEFDLRTVRGRQWLSVVRALAVSLDDPTASGLHPIVAAPMAECLMNGLLVAADHDHRRGLDTPKAVLPAVVRRAVDFMDEHADEPLSVAQISRHLGVSVRALQLGFQTSLGTTPMRHLKRIRLQRVRRELVNADPQTAGVTEIARRWGFLHAGRFAGEYREAFGVSPSRDLRAMPYR